MSRLFGLLLLISLVVGQIGGTRRVRQDFNGCGGVYTKKQFTIQSPNYPNGYQSNSTCVYILKGEECPTYFNFQFLDFDLEKSLGCSKDRLEIGQQDALCGNKVGIKNYFVEDGVLNLKFVSNGVQEARGFNILVTRWPCNQKPSEFATTTSPEQVQPPTQNNCCLDIYNKKRFIITNPGFPHGHRAPLDCVYRIQRANDEICRLRLHFNFFWSGIQETHGCEGGFLEIDNKRVCGCRSGLKLISIFDQSWSDTLKLIRYRNDGYSNNFHGFAIEIIQDECPKKNKNEHQTSFHHYHDQNNRVSFPDKEHGVYQKALLVSEGLLPFSQQRDEDTVKHYYYFQPPKQESDKDVEQTTYEDTSSFNPFLPHGSDDYKCRMFGMMQWAILAKQTLFKNMPKCDRNEGPEHEKCVTFDMQKGHIQSPGYPFSYPRNLNQCYRFVQKPGFCSVKLYMEDFNLEDSFQCKKDYVVFGNKYRYCGNRLYNTISTLVFKKPYEDFFFVTDNCFCGRGFKAWYEQMPCEHPTTPIIPTLPTVPTTEITTLAPTPPPNACGGKFRSEYFDLEVYGYEGPTCEFNIYKLNEGVCFLDLSYVSFNLDCDYEYLLINGAKYCGLLSNQISSINFDEDILTIMYVRKFVVDLTSRRFRIQAQQNYRNCIPDPEANPDNDLLLRKSSNSTSDFKKLDNIEMVKGQNQEYEVTLTNLNNDICGIIMNVDTGNLDDICNMIETSRTNVTCKPLQAKSLYVPYNNNKIQLKMKNDDILQHITYKEINCS